MSIFNIFFFLHKRRTMVAQKSEVMMTCMQMAWRATRWRCQCSPPPWCLQVTWWQLDNLSCMMQRRCCQAVVMLCCCAVACVCLAVQHTWVWDSCPNLCYPLPHAQAHTHTLPPGDLLNCRCWTQLERKPSSVETRLTMWMSPVSLSKLQLQEFIFPFNLYFSLFC